MTPQQANKILTEQLEAEVTSWRLDQPTNYVAAMRGDEEASLDGEFTADMLEAIAAWMRDPDACSVPAAEGST